MEELLSKLANQYETKEFSNQNILTEYLSKIGHKLEYRNEKKKGKSPYEEFSAIVYISLYPNVPFLSKGKNKKEMRENICDIIISKIIRMGGFIPSTVKEEIMEDSEIQMLNQNHTSSFGYNDSTNKYESAYTAIAPLNTEYESGGLFHLLIQKQDDYSYIGILIQKSKERAKKILIIGQDYHKLSVKFPEFFILTEKPPSNQQNDEKFIYLLLEFDISYLTWIKSHSLYTEIYLKVSKSHFDHHIIGYADYINETKV